MSADWLLTQLVYCVRRSPAGPLAIMAWLRFWHKHKWGEWERAWGKGSAKGYILERKCAICGKTDTKVIR